MSATLWTITIVVAVAYTAGGAALLLMSRQRYRALATNQQWVDDFGDGHLRTIGVLKLAGAAGLVLPVAVGVAPVLTPLAACGLALFMAGAATTRFRRSEWLPMFGDTVFLAVFAFLAWGWFALLIG
ncbi:DoxX family protein [Mycobacterium sp. AMU20-3851]|uniref:DoxX family protein n=1 Tax=Mycobacterium sp. AMU20-3851 TaxID=3122055 RepID=UPI0037553F46